jgi:prepilin-type processing-associated H-X9-DG protein
MPVSFTCPHCGAQTSVADQFAGQTGPCAQCGKMITVPALGATGGPPPSSGAGAATGASIALILAIVGIGGVCVVGILIALLLPAVQSAREAARRSQCTNNLRQIGIALHNYNDAYGSFPPAYLADESGRPMHSWRVLILPFMDEMSLYEQYDFTEPWDGPRNSQFLARMPATYGCPSDPTVSGGTTTQYVYVVGPETISDGATPCRMSDVTDGLSNTIAVVESTNSVNWMEPADLTLSGMSMAINDPAGNAIGSDHPAGANVLFMDGSVRLLSEALDQEMLRYMLLRNDGQVINGSGF